MTGSKRRLLIIDDNAAIHEDFRKVLCRSGESAGGLSEAEAQVFGTTADEAVQNEFRVDAALQGDEGIAMVRKALADGDPYAVAFVDVRMPPGRDGVETVAVLFGIDPNLQVVICTAYSDYSWQQIRSKLGSSDRLMILKKPFDPMEVQQFAHALSQKWQRASAGKDRLAALQQMIRRRSEKLHGTTAWLEMDDSELAIAAEMTDLRAQQDLVLEDDLRRALERGEICVHYQPLVNLATRRVVSVEALARWEHPAKGWISPNLFIPIAERSGLILELGEFVLRTACRQAARWQSLAPLNVDVNVSAVQLQRQNVLALARGVLRETGLAAARLTLEITESALIENLDQHLDALRRLRADGVGVAIDDFGTGYSSLSYLQRLPIDCLKIDRSFVRQIHVNQVDASIVTAITAMAHSMDVDVVAEGVEHAAQLQTLRALGCDCGQGYLFAPPMSASECEALLEASARGADAANRATSAQPARPAKVRRVLDRAANL